MPAKTAVTLELYLGGDGGEWSDSPAGRFTSGQASLKMRLGGPRAGLDALEKKIFAPARNRTSIPRSSSQWPSYYTDSYTGPIYRPAGFIYYILPEDKLIFKLFISLFIYFIY